MGGYFNRKIKLNNCTVNSLDIMRADCEIIKKSQIW